MNGGIQNLPSGWQIAPDTGAWMRDTIHRMGRRCRNWDYRGRGVYLITLAASTRGSGMWGRVVAEIASDSAPMEAGAPRMGVKEAGAPRVGVKEAGTPRVGVSPLAAKSSVKFRPNAIGRLIEAEWLHLAEAWPGVKLLAHQVMEDHFHGVIATPSFMKKSLGATCEFAEKAESLLEAAAHGAVLISPCISHGEKEIARRAFAAGAKVITLANKGFSPLYKPDGKLFDQCASGNLLMLAPAAWPYLPGEKPMTRIDACVLNRIAQLIAGNGAAEIDYKGIRLEGVEEAMHRATRRME